MGITFEKLSPQLQERIKRENPGAFRSNNTLDRIRPEVAEPDKGSKGQDRKLEGGEECRGFRIKLICVRRKLLDTWDNLPASCKPIIDRLTERLGFKNDADKRLKWNIFQIPTTGAEGVLIVIETFDINKKTTYE